MKRHLLLSAFLVVLAGSRATAQQPEVFSFEPGESHPYYSFGFLFPGCGPTSIPHDGFNRAAIGQGHCFGWGGGAGGPPATIYNDVSSFTLQSLFVTSRWYEHATLDIWGFREGDDDNFLNGATPPGQLTASFFRTVQIFTSPQHLQFDDWTGLVRLSFNSWGGAPADPRDYGQAYAIDAVTVVTATPEPTSALLLASGLVLLGGVARRRRRANPPARG